MNGQASHQTKILSSQELTPRDDTKKIVSEILKRVDQLIKKGNLDLAMSEIHSAKEIDPRNVYTLALEERVNVLLADGHKCAVEQHTEAGTTQESHTVPVQTQSPVVASPLPHPFPVASAPAQIQPQLTAINIEEYRKVLMDAWGHGAITPEQEVYVRKVRALSNISEEDNARIEKEVKHECYKNILYKLLATPATLNVNLNTMNELQKLYQISEEEHLQFKSQFAASIRQRKQRDKLLVIDDDVRLLELLATSLEDGGFDVTALSTSDEAYALLRKLTPDLILCDINLETSTMGGFTFYERVQELKHLQNIPFIFLTGLTDEALVRTGKELGVDDYLMKPISEQTLLSTLRGKLKRFRQLRRISETSSPTFAMA